MGNPFFFCQDAQQFDNVNIKEFGKATYNLLFLQTLKGIHEIITI